MLVGMSERGIVPDAIVFADTGGEKPETYRFLEVMQKWVKSKFNQEIVIAKHPTDTLRDSCFRNGTLPSKAYGFPGCSVKFKHQLMEKYETFEYGPDEHIVKAIGYHVNETRRSDVEAKGRYSYRYFLREWNWTQMDCVSAITRAGLPLPWKSACYFCPSSKPHEIIWLSKIHPALFADAVAMEQNAEAYHAVRGNITKGLGRQFSWQEIASLDDAALEQLPEPDQIPCMCYDGELEDE